MAAAPGEAHLARQLARRVRDLRAARGLTFAALAVRAGVSKGMLVQIEQTAVNPSLGVLVRIADALGVSLPSLLESRGTPRLRLFDAKSQRAYWRGKRGSAAVLLGGSDRPSPVECWRWTISPRDGYASHAHPRGTEEIVVVLRGTLTLELEERPVRVPSGSCVAFGADVDHAYRNGAARTPLDLMMFVVTPGTASSSPQSATRPAGSRSRDRRKG